MDVNYEASEKFGKPEVRWMDYSDLPNIAGIWFAPAALARMDPAIKGDEHEHCPRLMTLISVAPDSL
jgi:hypothetical protein